ncbi:MAG: WGR domain-containing protein [Actinobacteria bacterium]|nr:WGR domain-containing protein [Actinomycetota bacterium]
MTSHMRTTMVMAEVKSQTLYYRNGSSDKVYHAQIEQTPGGYVVTFSYGRRGSTLTTGTKTSSPVDFDSAVKVFDKLIAGKKAKGYSEGEDGTPYLHTEKAGQVSGLLPQLLNTVDDHEVTRIVHDPAWLMQQKFDGRRLMLRKTGQTVEGINKLGLVVAVAAPITQAALDIPTDFSIDGEAIGDHYHVFDALSIGGNDLRGQAYRDRYRALADMIGAGQPTHIHVADSWGEPGDKANQLAAFRAKNAEGVVFKRADAPYTAGRPNSGGTQLKFKFVATLSAKVLAVNAQRSVAVGLLDGAEWRAVGNVTVPANRDIPSEGEVVEVRYLYAYQGGSLYQPVFLGMRDDIETHECVVAQLKYKTAAGR